MTSAALGPRPWPPLRQELALLPGPSLPDGQPSWTLHDPIRNAYFQLDWLSFEVLSRWHLGDPGHLAQAVNGETTLHIDTTDVEQVAAFIQHNELAEPMPHSAIALAHKLAARQDSWWKWLLHHYLFFRLALVQPDRWLGRWLPAVTWLFTRRFGLITLTAGAVGVLGVAREWQHFVSTLVDLVSWTGLAAYGLTVVIVKVMHELGHAFTAKRFGCKVPTMGVAFLVMWPMAYTDTNEVWKLTRRDQRLKVAAAGMATELTVALWATLAWVLLPDGLVRTMAFLLATTTWVASVAINASPFMRFDGYFLLSDYLQIPNLHGRSFALARWHLREVLFGLNEAPPETFPKRQQAGLIVFAWATWLYRLVLFLGIAVLVYHMFFKALGIFLFVVEILWFVLLPLNAELRQWRQRWSKVRSSRRTRWSLAWAMMALMLCMVPLPTRVSGFGMLEPAAQLPIYAPPHAQVEELPVADAQAVKAQSLLLRLASADLTARRELLAARQENLAQQSRSAPFDREQRGSWQVLQERLVSNQAEQGAMAADAVRYQALAPSEGVLRDLDPDLRVGDWLTQRELVARFVADGPSRVVTYVDDDAVQRIRLGSRALWMAEGTSGATLQLEVTQIDTDASRTLSNPELASLFGGHVQVREKAGLLYPERAAYRVVLQVTEGQIPAQHIWRGHLSIASDWEPLALRLLRSALSVIWRESGF